MANGSRHPGDASLTQHAKTNSIIPSQLSREELVDLFEELQNRSIEWELQVDSLAESMRSLSLERDRLRRWFDALPIGCAVLGEDHTIIDVNQPLASLLGEARDHVVGRPVASLLPPARRTTIFETMRTLQDPEAPRVESELLTSDGPVSVWLQGATPPALQGPDGDGMLITVQRAHDMGEDDVRQTVLRAGIIPWSMDCETGELSVDDAFWNIIGQNDVPPHPLLDALLGAAPGNHSEHLRKAFDAVCAGETNVLDEEFPLICADGPHRWMRFRGSLPDGAGARAMQGVVYDITDRKRAEEMRQEVESMMRHDLRTPLISAQSLSRVLMDDVNLEPNHKEMLQDFAETAATALQMLDLSMHLHAIESGVYHYRPKASHMLLIVEKAIKDLHSKGRSAGVSVRLDAECSADCPVYCEEGLAYSVIMNLVKNAIEASQPGGVVTLSVRNEEVLGRDMLYLEVHNETAMPEEIITTFFHKYATHGKKNGMGLGSYAAWLLTRTMHGQIDFCTSAEDGTRVWVLLPRFDPAS